MRPARRARPAHSPPGCTWRQPAFAASQIVQPQTLNPKPPTPSTPAGGGLPSQPPRSSRMSPAGATSPLVRPCPPLRWVQPACSPDGPVPAPRTGVPDPWQGGPWGSSGAARQHMRPIAAPACPACTRAGVPLNRVGRQMRARQAAGRGSPTSTPGERTCRTPPRHTPRRTPRSRDGGAAGRSYGGAADIWSIGVIMYELLAAQLPFSGSTMSALRKAICRGEYAPLPAYISPSCRCGPLAQGSRTWGRWGPAWRC